MKRVFALATAALLFATAPALAQTASDRAHNRVAPAAASRVDFSPRAAGIDAMAAAPERKADKRETRTAQNTQGRSFWKTPWPYVIIAGVVTAGVLIAGGAGDGIY
ncbi:MAG TPA: hypothetical protein VMM93_05460 [Vicinamibacterales bacterium]|nr:hypothetical protein [Vicinamibacterales bacterium]